MLGRGLPIAPRPEPRNEADLGVGRGEEAGLQDVSYTEGFPAKLWGGGQVLLSYPAPPPKLLPRESPLQARLCLKAWTEGFLSSNDLTLYQQVAEGCWDSILRKTRKTLSQGLSCINES